MINQQTESKRVKPSSVLRNETGGSGTKKTCITHPGGKESFAQQMPCRGRSGSDDFSRLNLPLSP